MNRKRAVLGVLVLLLSCIIARIGRRRAFPNEDRITITISAPKSHYKRAEPIVCKVEIKNIGAEPFFNFKTWQSDWEPYTFIVRDAQGVISPGTAFNTAYIRRAAASRQRVLNGFWIPDFKPGDTVTERVRISDHVDMASSSSAGPAVFSVQVERFGVLSNAIHITVGP